MQPGELYWVEYPQGDGREQAGRRPCLILQNDGYAARSPLVVSVPLTSTPGIETRFPAVVPVAADAQNGLTADSFALVFQIRATDRRRFRGRIGTVAPEALERIYQALDLLTGRPNPPAAQATQQAPAPPQPGQRTLDI